MKKSSVILFLILFANTIHAQCIANAGSDTAVCMPWYGYDTIQLGGNPTAVSGVGPYSYTWEIEYFVVFPPDTFVLTASDFLNDTTIANPLLINPKQDTMIFKVNVVDDNSNSCSDTIIVIPSVFGTSIHSYTFDILQGDTTGFGYYPNVFGGIPPLTYLWQPNDGLIDSTLFTNILASPDSSTSYFLTITDSAGCIVSGAPCFYVNVGYAGINEMESFNYKIYPNPCKGVFNLQSSFSHPVSWINIYNYSGQLVHVIPDPSATIDISSLHDGSYIIEFEADQKIYRSSVVLKR